MNVVVEPVSGSELLDVLPEVARLRIEVFREFPYLYEGSEEAERKYLASYTSAKGAVVVLARAGGEVVGASTGLPMIAAENVFREPFVVAGLEPAEWFYFGESVLRASMRGQGIGHRFFDEREDWSRALGFTKFAFCAVVRPADHPLRPAGYRPHDVFWKKRGFQPRPGMVARLGWRQIDASEAEVPNELMFWTKEDPRQM